YHSLDTAKNFKMHYVIDLDSDIISDETYVSQEKNDTVTLGTEISGEKAGIHVTFANKQVNGKLAIPYISEAQALANLASELDGQTYESVQKAAEETWEEHLSRIEIESEDEDQLRTFYSAMYRTFLYPHKAYEYDEKGQ